MLHVRTLHNHIVPCTLEVCTQYEKETHFKRRFISCDLDVRVCKILYVSYVKLFLGMKKLNTLISGKEENLAKNFKFSLSVYIHIRDRKKLFCCV
jgi:hypothetical protein